MSVEQLLAVEYLTQLLDFAPIGVVRVDETGRIAAWNQKGCRMLGGVSFEQAEGTIFDLLPEKDRVRRLINASLAGATDSPVEIFDLDPRDAVSTSRCGPLLCLVDRPPDTAMLLLQDVTDRVVAENDREESLRQIHFLAEASAALSSSLDLPVVLERLAEKVVPFPRRLVRDRPHRS